VVDIRQQQTSVGIVERWSESYRPVVSRSIQSIERAAAVLRLLARGPGRLGVVELAGALGLAKGTVHGILRTLAGVGFVEQDTVTGKYQLGAALLHLGTSYLDVNELRSRAINWADALASRSGEAVRIGSLLEGRVLIVHHVFRPDDSLQTVEIGMLLPAHASALGKVLLAYDRAAAGAASRELEPYTRRTLSTASALNSALTQIRERGWAAEVEEMSVGVAGVAAAIRGHGGLVVGSIGITGAVDRICDSTGTPRAGLASQVQDAARAVSRELGQRW
jgi:DNA-binding IclR family transcriptional regulator